MLGVDNNHEWPLGPALRKAREARGLSVRAAARRTNGAVSSGRWYQLESGYQKLRGQNIPIGTTASTVAAAARAVDWDVNAALEIAGFDSVEPEAEVSAELHDVPIDALLDEIRRRVVEGSETAVALPSASEVLGPIGTLGEKSESRRRAAR